MEVKKTQDCFDKDCDFERFMYLCNARLFHQDYVDKFQERLDKNFDPFTAELLKSARQNVMIIDGMIKEHFEKRRNK